MSVRWGVIGTGNIAHTFIKDLQSARNGEASAVSSRSRERAEAFAREFDMPYYYDSVEAMLDARVCDVVYVATPHSSHVRDALFCMKKNHHVLCEKPITVNAAQCREVVDAHRRNSVLCMEAYWTIFLPPVIKAMEWLSQGRIGSLRLIQANFGMQFPYDPKGRLYNPQLAGGALLDIGIYPCMLGNILFDGPPERVHASGVLTDTGVDDTLSFQLEYGGGRVLQGSSSISCYLKNRAILFGDTGRIEIEDFWMSRRARLVTDDGADLFEDERQTMGYDFEADAVAELITQNKREHPVLTLQRSYENMQTLDEIRRQVGVRYPFEESPQ